MPLQFREVCKEKGISPSYTRLRIYDYLEQSHDHPTVDQIYKKLSIELPTLSKTTVYNVLKLFMEHGLVQAISAQNNEKRYELTMHDHSHFTCSVCNTIYDIPKVELSYKLEDLSGFEINQEEVNLVGVCPACVNKK